MKKIFAMLAVVLLCLTTLVAAQDTEPADKSKEATDETNTEKSSDATEVSSIADREVRLKAKMEKLEEAKKLREAPAMKKELRGPLLELEKGLNECKAKKTAECDAKRKEAKTTAKNLLEKTASRIKELLENRKAKVSASNNPNKDALLAKLDAQLTALGEAQKKAVALGEESTKKDLKDAMQEMKRIVKESKTELHVASVETMNHKLGNVLGRSGELEKKLENSIAKLESQGVSTASVNVGAFKQALEMAKALHTETTSLLEKANAAEPGAKDEAMKAAVSKLRESNQALKDANSLLKEITANLKSLSATQKDKQAGTA